MIRIKNLKKSFGQNLIFQDVNLEVKKGDSVVIIGGSGCGKSTLLRCINKLETPDSGEIYINGQNILAKDVDIDAVRLKMGMVYQQFNLFKHLNVLENIMLAPMNVLGKNKKEAALDAVALLKKVGMESRMFAMPCELSGGQKQRVAIARTLAMNPDVILFDEPTSALDPTMVDEVESVIKDLVDSGMTCLIVTHEMNFARRVSNKVVFLAEKSIYDMGTPDEIFVNPQKRLTKQFIYKTRMYEESLQAGCYDRYEIEQKWKKILQRYEYNSIQLNYISVLFDEIIYPFFSYINFDSEYKVILSLLCSETSSHHILTLKFTPHVDLDCFVDELSFSILNHYHQDMQIIDSSEELNVIITL